MARRARDSDESAFAEIVRRYSPRVFKVASRFFRQRSLVEEAAQEVFLKAFTNLSSYRGDGSLEGWLTRIAHNTCLNMLRAASRRPELVVSDLSDQEDNWLEGKLDDVATAQYRSTERDLVAADLADKLLETLSPEDRLTLMMIDGEDASIKEVAETTGWSESKVKVRAFRARQKIRGTMAKLLGKGKIDRGSSPTVREGASSQVSED